MPKILYNLRKTVFEMADSKESSPSEIIEAGFATTKQMVRRRIQSAGFPNWRYANLDANGVPKGNYVLQPGEQTYQDWLAEQEAKKTEVMQP